MTRSEWSAATWTKALRSSFEGNCVEVAHGPVRVGLRDSKDPAHILDFSYREWAAFVAAARDGEFNRPQ
jgi:Domain of unknown function (DUF397)